MINVNSPDFAYVLGYFMADGSFYKDSSGYRFEFNDGSPYEKELGDSFIQLSIIKNKIENFLCKNLPSIKKKGHLYKLSFRDKKLSDFFINKLNIFPGKKHKKIDIPKFYTDSNFELNFWRGYLDGDGSVSRKYRRVAVESMSRKIILSFASYLKKQSIYFTYYKSRRGSEFSHVIIIRSVSFRDFVNKIGFNHPTKSKLLKEKLKDTDFFISNNVYLNHLIGSKIDYSSIFDDTVFIENGLKIIKGHGGKMCPSWKNVKFKKIVSFLEEKGFSKNDILNIVNKYYFKKSKGSKNSIKLPLLFDKRLIKIARFVRIRAGGISFSKRYIESFNEDYNTILKLVENLFRIKPTYTCKNEPIFCSGVLSDFFSKILEKGIKYKYSKI